MWTRFPGLWLLYWKDWNGGIVWFVESNRLEYCVQVKVPVCATLADLPAKGGYNFDTCWLYTCVLADITPLKGFRADVFCPRDMVNRAGFVVIFKQDKCYISIRPGYWYSGLLHLRHKVGSKINIFLFSYTPPSVKSWDKFHVSYPYCQIFSELTFGILYCQFLLKFVSWSDY